MFKYQGEVRLLCQTCLYNKFGIGKLVTKKPIENHCEWCNVCQKLTMLEDKKASYISSTHVVRKFRCTKCGKKKISKIKKWKK